ncbi:A/G-specific adenine glycosylase [Puniceicoccales bacterium CK1056]|uniref:A/G-specific adenine glycosylase n=1 Tax=Oceanipulchritudo coccoides TaxID=2706888 RepID=A0A6B2M281_9BACT|nr:A/G-specific adenine glycosylase [Oceanipulchritudo coccoides]NDV62486.1 A/G-specific adenine glycosylase [Oceanipulchritudo coccoides]
MRGDFSIFRRQLLEWFDSHKRTLPWRTESSLYKTAVSEFMLQQTQVETVIPYFERWLAAFPHFEVLAAAPEAQVLKHWEGLGYYSRARNLHKLAKSIVEEGIPQTPDDWRKRPGIGPYTAAAISSIAQNQPEPVIDGNVIRVLARLEDDARPVQSSSEAQKRFRPFASQLIDPQRPGDYNEALMELGATTCRKARPACLLCPVQEHCCAKANGTQESVPVIVRKSATKREVHRLWLLKDECLLLHFYPESAPRLAGLAELPQLDKALTDKPLLSRSRGISSEQIREHIHALPADHPLSNKCLSRNQSRFISLADLDTISLSAPHKRWIKELLRKDVAR